MRYNRSTNFASYHWSSPKRPCCSLYPPPNIDPTPPTTHLQCCQQWMSTRCDQQPIMGRSHCTGISTRSSSTRQPPRASDVTERNICINLWVVPPLHHLFNLSSPIVTVTIL